MAEEKKSTNLKDRLKKNAPAPAGGPVAAPGGMPASSGAPLQPGAPVGAPFPGSEVMAPPMGAPLPGVPGIPGLGNDVAPPAFVQQQQAADAARARAAAAAADPFGASSVSHAAPHEVRIVMDDKAVDDKEVGRGSAGTFIAVGIVGVLALAGGYAVGDLVRTKKMQASTMATVTEVRTQVTSLGDTVNTIKQQVDAAAEHGNIVVQRGDADDSAHPAQATHPPTADDALITWFRAQDTPSFTPNLYAGKVGLLSAAVVVKLLAVQLGLDDVWRQLGQHASQTNLTNVRAALAASAAGGVSEMHNLLVTFARSNPDNPPFAQLVTLSGPPGATGAVPIAGAGIPAGQTRTPYTTGDIHAADLTNLAFIVAPGQGVVATAQAAAVLPWAQYRTRISRLKETTDQLATDYQALVEALNNQHASQ